MKALALLIIAAALFPLAADETPTISSPESLRRGEPAFIAFGPLPPGAYSGGYTLSIRFSDGKQGPRYLGFAAGGEPVPRSGQVVASGPAARRPPEETALFLISAPVDAALGEATVVVADAGGAVVAGARLAIADRTFYREDLRLDAALTSLRVEPDPRKTEQALRYQAVLASADPAAVFLDGGFVRPVETERRTSLFGQRRRYLYADGGVDVTTHAGIDYGCPVGTPVVAAGAGRVVMAEDRIVTGKTVVIEHLPGAYTIYMHLDAVSVSAGSVVSRGAAIGAVGMTGLATGPHLHWELRIMGVPCDPEALVGLDKTPPIRTIAPAIEGG